MSPDLVDIPAIASRLGVARQTVDMWRHRGILPQPDYHLTFPVWDWSTIEAWAQDSGRLPSWKEATGG